MTRTGKHDPLLYGRDETEGIVAVEYLAKKEGADEVALFLRRGDETTTETAVFEPFLIAGDRVIEGCPVDHRVDRLKGRGRLNTMAFFASWGECTEARRWLGRETGFSATAPGAPYLCINDPVQQYLMQTGRTLFLGMDYEELRRMQLDIECETTEGYDFCNAEREGDRIVAVGMSDSTGWEQVLSVADMNEKEMLSALVESITERDPDVLEGHNIFNFDLPYIATRARMHKVKLALGRDGSAPRRRPSRMSVGERTLSYSRFDVWGRHIVDTLFLVHAYDISHRSLDGFGLKEAAIHFGIAAPNRTYIDGSQIGVEFRRRPKKVLKYLRDDVIETRALSGLLSRSAYVQAQMLPYTYQVVCVRGNATKIDSLMLREYIAQGHSLPMPAPPRKFSGGYTDMFVEGVVQNVHHCDVRSLYPSLMLTGKIAPRHDKLNIFLQMLEQLRSFRLEAKERMLGSGTRAESTYHDALQATFKVLINSFYGYLGFPQARFSDFDAAEEITTRGRALLRDMIEWLRKHGAEPVEIDTDGIYFVPPKEASTAKRMDEFRQNFASSLPEGIDVEFDGEYKSMYSYKMKNYALLAHDGEVVIKGAALKSRGIEPFQREFLRELIRCLLEGREEEISVLKEQYEKAIGDREWPIERLAKSEMLQDAPATYAAKREGGKRPRAAAYELALASGREYRAGDMVAYYVTGEKKSVQVCENARLASAWDPKHRDENVPYYLGKLNALYKKFRPGDVQSEMDLGN